MTYNMPDNLTRFYEYPQYVNTITDGFFGILLLLVIFVIIFIATKNFKTSVAFALASFAAAFFSILFFIAGILIELWVYLSIGLAVLGVIALILDRPSYEG